VPVYDYICTSCRHRFEVFHGLNEAGPQQCPLCEGAVIRAFAPPTIHFKGSGWAKKDRRATTAPARRAAADPAKGGEPGSGEASSGAAGSGGSDSGAAGSGGSDSGEGPSRSSTAMPSAVGE
jgi:putative FmdB family regulatory protein